MQYLLQQGKWDQYQKASEIRIVKYKEKANKKGGEGAFKGRKADCLADEGSEKRRKTEKKK